MTRITHLDPAVAAGPVKVHFEAAQKKLGIIPNLYRVLGNAPAALDGYLKLGAALSGGSFEPKLREQIALTVAEINQCGYCLSAHSYIGANLGLGAEEIKNARQASARSERADAILKLARSIVIQRGEIGDIGVNQASQAGLSEADIIETVAHVVLNIFSNYVNHIAGTIVDFPEVQPGRGYLTAPCDCA